MHCISSAGGLSCRTLERFSYLLVIYIIFCQYTIIEGAKGLMWLWASGVPGAGYGAIMQQDSQIMQEKLGEPILQGEMGLYMDTGWVIDMRRDFMGRDDWSMI